MSKTHRLYAMTHSLYSGRARSYLIKHQILFLNWSRDQLQSRGFTSGEITHDSDTCDARGWGHSRWCRHH